MKIYTGCRDERGQLIVRHKGKPLRLVAPPDQNPSSGFECGYIGQGPRHLAYSLLYNLLGGRRWRRANRFYKNVEQKLIAQLPQNKNWRITTHQIIRAAHTA